MPQTEACLPRWQMAGKEPVMRLDNERESSNIEDRRGQGGGFGGGGGFPDGRGGIAGGGIGVVVVALIAMFFGVDPRMILGGADSGAPQPGYTQQAPVPQQARPPQQAGRAPSQSAARTPSTDDEQARFVSRVLASTEDVWTQEFRRAGRPYNPPTMVLYSGAVNSGCGSAQCGAGPFYCPADQKVYLDLSFFREMEQRLGAPGDFARAYVIAHEVGHHVQNVLGLLPRAQQAQARAGDRAEANEISVRVELMADCMAGLLGPAGRADARHPGAGRHRGGAGRRRRGGRRPPAAALARAGGAGKLHPWQQRPAGGLVPPRPAGRERPGLRRLRGALRTPRKISARFRGGPGLLLRPGKLRCVATAKPRRRLGGLRPRVGERLGRVRREAAGVGRGRSVAVGRDRGGSVVLREAGCRGLGRGEAVKWIAGLGGAI
jgi:predicted metalloprotease